MAVEYPVVFEWDGEDDLDNESALPGTAVEYMPQWYKQLGPLHEQKGMIPQTTAKMCMPFSDAMTAGFIIPVPQDIKISVFDGEVSVEEGEEVVTVYGTQESVEDAGSGNCQYTPPEIKIDNDWKIKTPPSYSSLICKPINRKIPELTPNAMFVDTDQYDGRLPIPAVLDGQTIELKKGDPLAHVLPLRREELISRCKCYSFSEAPDMKDGYDEISSRLDTQPDFYRQELWVKKPTGSVVRSDGENIFDGVSGSDIQGILDQTLDIEIVDNSDEPDVLVQEYAVHDQFKDIFPEVYSASQSLPPWTQDFESVVDQYGEEEEHIEEWARRASSLGFKVPLNSSVTVSQTHDGDIDYESGDPSPLHPMGIEKMGKMFPLFQYNIVNVHNKYVSRTPEGYSTLYISPLNHMQKYYRSFSGIVEQYLYRGGSNAPGVLHTLDERFELEQGTPITQHISFKHESMLTNGVIVDGREDGDLKENFGGN